VVTIHLRRCLVILCCGCLMTACSPKNVVVLVPDPDGSVGRITVANAAGSVEIDAANESTAIRDAKTAPSPPAEMEKKDIDQLFSEALAIQPQPPVHFILYFEKDSTQLRPSSVTMLTDILSTIQARQSEHISVVGHSDTLGDKAYNRSLSMRRATAVKQRLVQKGIDEGLIDITSHGEENPLVKTADNVSNPKNRRVEVVIR
jgi:outer membrane protein OmpA-like peptidoglycan-associated protein